MRGQPGVIRVALSFAALLASLGLVIWRQSRALEVLRGLDAVRREQAVVEAERSELAQRIRRLESRSRVVTEAGSRLGMHVPSGEEIVILPMTAPGAGGTEVRR